MKLFIHIFLLAFHFCGNVAVSGGLETAQSTCIDIVNSTREDVLIFSPSLARDGVRGIIYRILNYTSQNLEQLGINAMLAENLSNQCRQRIEISVHEVKRLNDAEKCIVYSYAIRTIGDVIFQEKNQLNDDNFDDICRKIGESIASKTRSSLAK